MMLKGAIVPQINEAFVRSQRKHTSTLQYPFGFCSDVSFIDTIFSRNWYLSFVLGLLISYLTLVFLLLSLLVICSSWYFEDLFSFHEWKQPSTQIRATKYQTHLENQLNNVWTWNNSMLMKYHKRDSADRVRIIWAQFGGKCLLGTPRLTALKLFLEKVFSSDR
jgi:hypothetical protein